MTQVAGHFHLRLVNAETGNVRQEREFDNLVTDIGLEHFAKGWLNNLAFECVVGTGTNAPQTSDSTLGQFLAKTDVFNQNYTVGGAPYYVRSEKMTGRFNAGVISNTITEIGIRHRDSSVLWCRQLILDEQGQPSSITVLPNEYLDVTYTLYIYPNLQDKVFSFMMDGVTYNCVSRVALIARSAATTFVINTVPIQFQSAFSTQTLGDITGQPTGTSVGGTMIASSLPWDAAFPYSRSCSLTMDLVQGNVQGGIGSMLLREYYGLMYHQISFNPVLPKDNTVKMTLIFTDTVSRYTSPTP